MNEYLDEIRCLKVLYTENFNAENYDDCDDIIESYLSVKRDVLKLKRKKLMAPAVFLQFQ